MIRTNFNITVRSLLKHKSHTFTNIIGLVVGLASFILIVLWVQDELSYDSFHRDADNVYMVLRVEKGKRSAVTSKLLGPTLKSEVSEINEVVCYTPLPSSFESVIQYNNQKYIEQFAVTDNDFFTFFTFPLLEGDKSSAFSDPNSIVISEHMREKYFGSEQALGKSITMTFLGKTKLLTVTGIMKNLPGNSTIHADLLVPSDLINDFGANWDTWYNYSLHTYIRTKGHINKTDLEQKMLACQQRHYKEENLTYEILPIKETHLHGNGIEFFTTTGDIRYVYILSAVAAIILLIACINYMNLSNALSLKRAKEIGVKKTLGGGRVQLIKQHYSEAMVLVTVSLLLAIGVASFCLPAMNSFSGKVLTSSFFSLKFLITMAVIALVTIVLSGTYPALFILGFEPLQALKGKFITSRSSVNIRQGMVVFQFALSVIVILSTLIVGKQLSYVLSANLGYDKENLVCVSPNGNISDNFESFKNDALNSGYIASVSRSNALDASSLGSTDGINWSGKQGKFTSWIINVDEDFASTYGIKMKEGRFYSKDYLSDQTAGFVINDKAAKEMAFADPIGHDLEVWGRKGKIIGVTEDFNFRSLHNKIEPLIFYIPKSEELNFRCRTITFRLKPNSLSKGIDYLHRSWNSYFPDEVFNFYFVEDKLNTGYLSDLRMGKLFRYFSLLAIFIACLGLYSLMAFTVEQKNKEIGIYKVFGAKVSQVLYKLSAVYAKWILLSNLIALPVGYYFMYTWLNNFAFKTSVSIWPFVITVFTTISLALLTIIGQTFQAATRNPVEALRYE
jgi:putative ABC transport system permease protein